MGEHTVTLVPVGKSVSGCLDVYNYCAQKCILTYDANRGLTISNCSPNAYCPSNQIVDFYVTEITPTHGKFRINFEDVEQGADHDMDSVVKYEYCVGDACNPALPANQVKITLSSDYASGCIDQVLGFVISGTSEDGLYLPVKDSDTAPPPGDGNTPLVVASMPLTWEKTFTISGSSAATLLKNPLWYAAKWGGFEDINNNNKPDLSNEWDKDGDGKPDTYFFVANPLKLEEKLSKVFADILKRASSGTAVSVLSTSTRGSGCLAQAYFLPSLTGENNEELSWIGELKGLWVDPYGQIREDTDSSQDASGTNVKAQLELDKDKVLKFYNEGTKTVGHIYSSDKYGNVEFPCSPDETKELANFASIWNVGKKLWEMESDERNIYTTTNGSSLIDFKASNASILKSYLRACDDTDSQNVINYVRGEDIDICIDSDSENCSSTTCTKGHRDRTLTISGTQHVWKLGDIAYSTPRILSHFALNTYNIRYNDTTYADFIKEKVYDPTAENPIKRNDYLFVGANDGMLHCFYTGRIKEASPDTNHPGLKAVLEDPENKTPGTELWAYIPMNVLPYLKYLAYPDYCHIYYVDHRAMLIDASINGSASTTKTKDSWRTILIGELGFGGSPNPPSDAP